MQNNPAAWKYRATVVPVPVCLFHLLGFPSSMDYHTVRRSRLTSGPSAFRNATWGQEWAKTRPAWLSFSLGALIKFRRATGASHHNFPLARRTGGRPTRPSRCNSRGSSRPSRRAPRAWALTGKWVVNLTGPTIETHANFNRFCWSKL